jgi:bacterioferritin
LRTIHIGENVEKAIDIDCKAEIDAIKEYNHAIKVAGEYDDFGTREIFEKILKDEERHLDVSKRSLTRSSRWESRFFCTTTGRIEKVKIGNFSDFFV